ncbi:MAG: co-chaperone GroES [Chlamydiota bacterium]
MSVRKINPLSNRVLVKRADATVSRGGIFLPETAQEKPKQGKVLAVGPGRRDEKGNLKPLELKVGDRVLFSAYGGSEVEMEEEGEFLIVSENDILAVIG